MFRDDHPQSAPFTLRYQSPRSAHRVYQISYLGARTYLYSLDCTAPCAIIAPPEATIEVDRARTGRGILWINNVRLHLGPFGGHLASRAPRIPVDAIHQSLDLETVGANQVRTITSLVAANAYGFYLFNQDSEGSTTRSPFMAGWSAT